MCHLLARHGCGFGARVGLGNRLEVIQGEILLIQREVGECNLQKRVRHSVAEWKLVDHLTILADGVIITASLEIGLAGQKLRVVSQGIVRIVFHDLEKLRDGSGRVLCFEPLLC